jgi:hypothetical protein
MQRNLSPPARGRMVVLRGWWEDWNPECGVGIVEAEAVQPNLLYLR